jgi:hypothetical protein
MDENVPSTWYIVLPTKHGYICNVRLHTQINYI